MSSKCTSGGIKQVLDSLKITKEQQNEILNQDQRSESWAKAREKRLTTSNFGTAAGHNIYQKGEQLLVRMLWGGFSANICMKYGVTNEPVAFNLFKRFKQLEDPLFRVELCNFF